MRENNEGLVGIVEKRDTTSTQHWLRETTSTQHWLNISFEIGKKPRKEGKIFVPLSQEQLEAIRKTEGNAKRKAELTVDTKKKLVSWIFFTRLAYLAKHPLQ